MKKNKSKLLYFIFPLLLACKSKQVLLPPMVISEYELTNFCELPKMEKELVYTSAIYSGVEEYWALTSRDKNCKDLRVELEIPERVVIHPKFEKLFKDVQDKYWQKYLIIDAIGEFEVGNEHGYGHLGTNKAKFTIKKLINVQLIDRKRKFLY